MRHSSIEVWYFRGKKSSKSKFNEAHEFEVRPLGLIRFRAVVRPESTQNVEVPSMRAHISGMRQEFSPISRSDFYGNLIEMHTIR